MNKRINNKYKQVEEVSVWVRAYELNLNVYKATEQSPPSGLFRLVSQVRRSTSSLPANISEGFYRKSTKELVQVLYTVRGSLEERKYHSPLAYDLGYINKDQHQQLMIQFEEVGKRLRGWIKSLNNKV